MNSIKAILFDFDMTLADSAEGVIECALLTMKQMGIEGIDDRSIKKTIGMTLENSYLFLAGGHDGMKAAEYKNRYIKNADKIVTQKTKWMNGAVETVSFLKINGIKTGIVSTKIKRRLKEFIDKENISGSFDVIVGGDEVKNNKPDPEGLLKALHMLDVEKAEAIFAGDSLIDQDTAYNAGVRFAAVLTGETKKKEFDAAKVTFFAEALYDLKTFVKRNSKIKDCYDY